MDLFIGITTWNDEQILPTCLHALQATLAGVDHRVHVFDNASIDSTAQVARDAGCEVKVCNCTQPDALNYLLGVSRAPVTLLMHSDVVMLSSEWFPTLSSLLTEPCVLVSPEDIGLGNYGRPFGKGMPESSFMLFETHWAKSARQFSFWRGQRRVRHRRGGFMEFDFYGPHVTHRIPQRIRQSGKSWAMMDVWPSGRRDERIYSYEGPYGALWDEDPAYRVYGWGNFYGYGGVLTHYHNWYARSRVPDRSAFAASGCPAAFIDAYSRRFRDDYLAGTLELPTFCQGEDGQHVARLGRCPSPPV